MSILAFQKKNWTKYSQKEYKERRFLNSMLKLKRISETYGVKVYTDMGEYFGDIDESVVLDNKIYGWRVKATRGSYLSKTVSGARGVLVPHQLVKAIGDIMIISKAVIPTREETTEVPE